MTVVKVAAVQASPVYYDLAKTLEKAIHFIENAAEQGSGSIALGHQTLLSDGRIQAHDSIYYGMAPSDLACYGQCGRHRPPRIQ